MNCYISFPEKRRKDDGIRQQALDGFDMEVFY